MWVLERETEVSEDVTMEGEEGGETTQLALKMEEGTRS